MEDTSDQTILAAHRLLDKVSGFVATLDDHERALMAALLAPGIDAAWNDTSADDDAGFRLTWTPRRLPAHLVDAVRKAEFRITTTQPGA